MRKKNKTVNSSLVKQSNALINASYQVSLAEKRIILYMLTKIHKDDENFKPYRMNIKEFLAEIGTDTKNLYERAKQATKELLNRVLEIKTSTGLLQITFLSSAEYYDKEGYVELSFDPKLKPYLLQLKECFTTYAIENILSLKSIHSMRIYELLKQFQSLKERTFKLRELKYILGLQDQYFNDYTSFKKRVILQAQKELNQSTDISFDFEEIKLGRKIDSIKFIIKNKIQLENPETEIPQNTEEKPKETIIENTKQNIILNKLLDLGVENTKALNFIQIKDLDTLEQQIEYAEKQYKTKKIHSNLGGYLVSIIEKDANVKNDYDKKIQEKEKQQKELEKQQKELEKQKQEQEKLLIQEYETEFQEERNTKLAQLMPDFNEEILKEYYSTRKEKMFVFDSKGNFKFETAIRFFRVQIAKENNLEDSEENFKTWVKQNKQIELGQKTVNGQSQWVIIGKQLSFL